MSRPDGVTGLATAGALVVCIVAGPPGAEPHGATGTATPGPGVTAAAAPVRAPVHAPLQAPVPAPIHAEGAPPGHTGGFGEPTCRACHDGYELGLDGSLGVGGLPGRWEPGAHYTVTLVLESAGMSRAGFQASFRFADGDRRGRSAGATVTTVEGVVVAPGENGVEYVQHAPGGAWTDGAEVVRWSFGWTAPERSAGAVVLHAAANSANGDDSPFGDIVYSLADTVEGPGPTSPSAPSAR